MNKTFAATFAGAAFFVAAAGSGVAQTVDYGATEAMFGEPVTTSATGKPQRASDAPVTMDIITAEDIRRSAAREPPGPSLWSCAAPSVAAKRGRPAGRCDKGRRR